MGRLANPWVKQVDPFDILPVYNLNTLNLNLNSNPITLYRIRVELQVVSKLLALN
jgi:hypothetical protein